MTREDSKCIAKVELHPHRTNPMPKSSDVPKKARVSHHNKVLPEAPRRNLSSFVMFANHRRTVLKEMQKTLTYPELQTAISAEWKSFSQKDKEQWIRLVESDKARYRNEMKLYKRYGSMWVWVVGAQMRTKLGLEGGWCDNADFASPLGCTTRFESPSRLDKDVFETKSCAN